MEDLDALLDRDLDEDFLTLMRADLGPVMFSRSAKNLIGDDWKNVGEEILKDRAPELLSKFKKYADQSTT